MWFDWPLLHWIQTTLSCDFLNGFMPKFTALGNFGLIWVLAGAAMACTKKYRVWGFVLLAALLAGTITGNAFLKNLVMRPRPCWTDPLVPMLIHIPSDYSFPSGHTMSSVIGAAVLTAANRNFAWLAIPAAVLMAFSRLYLWVHFPTDILGGAALGLALGGLAVWAGKKLQRAEAL